MNRKKRNHARDLIMAAFSCSNISPDDTLNVQSILLKATFLKYVVNTFVNANVQNYTILVKYPPVFFFSQ